MNLVPPREPEKPQPFVPESDEELGLWIRFVCAALESERIDPARTAALMVLEHRRLRQKMKATQAYR